MCEPCLIDYQYFTKTETFTLDGDMIVKVLDAESQGSFPVSHFNTKDNGKSDKYDSITKKIIMAFKFIKLETINELYEKFKWDFELFGYDIQPFLDLHD